MSESHVSPTAPSAGDGSSCRRTAARRGGSDPSGGRCRTSRWTAGRITALVIGALLVLFSLILLGAGGTALWADRTQREAGYVTTDVHEFSTSGSALATESTELGSAGVGWLYSPGVLDELRIGVTPAHPARRCSSGSAPPATSIATSAV